MDTLSFLQRVLPDEGLYCVMFIHDGKVKHNYFPSIEELASATEKLDSAGFTTYYAVSSFQGRRRTQDNVSKIKVIAVDLDVDPAGKPNKYAAWKDALKDLGRFVSQVGLPKPLIIHSGVGLHVYWVLTDSLSPAEWRPLAASMKSCAIANGLRIDPTVTSDSARVLRAVGTTNRKNDGRVRVLLDAEPVSVDALRSCFGTDAPVSVKAPQHRDSGLSASLQITQEFPPCNPDALVSKCQQLRWAVENQADVDEPLWYRVVGIAAFCHNAEATAIKWSQDHPEFDPNKTLAKMYQWHRETDGPPKCEKFEDLNPNGCRGCKFKGRIKSPARLGLQYEEITVQAPSDPVIDVAIPKPFKRTAQGIKLTIDDTDVDVCPFDIFPISYGRDESLNYEVARFSWKRPHIGWQILSLRQAYLADGHREFSSAIADQGIVLYNKKQTEFFQLMLRTYLEALKQKRTMTNLYSTMGWKNNFDEFIIGNTIIRRDGDNIVEEAVSLSSGTTKLGGELWTHSGSLEDWVQFTTLLQKAHLPWHMFALCVGISSPLYAFTGLKGMTLSLYGPTGGGKTLIQYWQQSVWGNPDKLHFNAKFTQNALFSRLGLYCNLPMTIDEATMVDDKEVGEFLYWITQGRDKARLNRQAEERDARTWSTTNTISTNKSWNSKLTASGLETDAQMARLLEINVPQHSLFMRDSSAGRRIYEFLTTNYGLVGREFIKRLMALGQDGVRAIIAEHSSEFNAIYKSKFAGVERYWEQMIILADLSGKLCQEWGLIDFEYALGTEWVLKQLGAIRRNIIENKVDAFDLLTEYMNEYASTAVTVMHTANQVPTVDFQRMPRSDIRIRFDVYRTKSTERFDRGTVMIDRTHFRRWLSQRGSDYKTFMNDLQDDNVLATPKSGKASLAKDTPAKLGQSYVFGLNLKHPRLVGILDEVDQASEDLVYSQLKVIQ